MKSLVYCIGLIFLGTSLYSCDDFLQKDPPSSPSEAVFWQKESDFESALTACYSVAYDVNGFSEAIPCYDNLTDNSICQYDEDTYGQTKRMLQGDIYPTTSGFVSGNYNGAYKAIARCNLVLEKLGEYQGGDMTEESKTYIEAQAKALRAYYYHWLFLCYKEVPLVTEVLTLDNQYQPKATRAEIYAQIIKDFSEAAAAFDDRTYMDTPGHFTKSACYAYMAKTAMFQAWSDENGIPCGTANPDIMREVVSYCEQVKGYSLDTDLRMPFVDEKQISSQETIFSVRYKAPDLTNGLTRNYASWSSLQVQRNLVDAFECTDGLPWGESPLTVTIDESMLTSSTVDDEKIAAEREKLFENRDKRMRQWIISATIYRFPENAGYPDNAVIHVSEPSKTGWGPLKFIQPFTAEVNPYSVQCGADVCLMRYAHVLLMLAEAENEANGPTQKAYNAINQVRLRAEQPALPEGLTQEQFRERVRNEWRVEACFEGWRYFQLKQWNELRNVPAIVESEPLYPLASKYEERFVFFPLPQAEIDKANGILVQDPAYN